MTWLTYFDFTKPTALASTGLPDLRYVVTLCRSKLLAASFSSRYLAEMLVIGSCAWHRHAIVCGEVLVCFGLVGGFCGGLSLCAAIDGAHF